MDLIRHAILKRYEPSMSDLAPLLDIINCTRLLSNKEKCKVAYEFLASVLLLEECKSRHRHWQDIAEAE